MNLLAGFLLGLAGSLHCLGMCGPLMALMPFRKHASAVGMAGDRLLYHAARVVVYALLGLVMGLGVSALHVNQFERAIALFGGTAMIAFATMQLILHRSPVPHRFTSRFAQAISKRIQKLLQGRRGAHTLVLLGSLNALLPCGLLYAALAGSLGASASDQGVVQASAFMAAFGIGTLPMMLAVSIGIRFLTPSASLRLRSWAPALAMFAGAIIILRGLALGIPYLSPLQIQASSAMHSQIPPAAACCAHH